MLPYSNILKTSPWSVDTFIAWVGRHPIAGLKTKFQLRPSSVEWYTPLSHAT